MLKPKMIENEKDFCCSKGHQLPVITIALDPKLSREQRLLCTECLESTDIDGKAVGLKKIISLIEENQIKKMEKVENLIMDQIKLIQSLNSIVDQMKSDLIQSLNQLSSIIMGWIQNLQQQGSQYNQYSFYEELEIMILNQNKTDLSLQILIPEIQKTNFCWISKLHPKLEQFNQFREYDKCQQLLQSFELCFQKFTQSEQVQSFTTFPPPQTIQSNDQSNFKPFNYQLIEEFSIPQSEWCGAIAIDKDCSTLVAGYKSQIKIFEFNQGMIKQTQTLFQHKGLVLTLNFMMKSKQFISSSCDNSIIIWEKNKNNKWSSQQILNGYSNDIQCLVISTNKDLIISGSEDKTIKFWIKNNEWLCQQTITDNSKPVYGLTLNQQQNRVVSCGYDTYILIIEKSGQNTEWKVVQKITLDTYGFRVCFINDNIFTFSPLYKEQILVFEMNTTDQQFSKIGDIPVKCEPDANPRFPQQYINSKCIILSKNGQYVNLIRKSQNGEFQTEQSIHYGTNSLYGGMSDDGEYLITWDNQSKYKYRHICYNKSIFILQNSKVLTIYQRPNSTISIQFKIKFIFYFYHSKQMFLYPKHSLPLYIYNSFKYLMIKIRKKLNKIYVLQKNLEQDYPCLQSRSFFP